MAFLMPSILFSGERVVRLVPDNIDGDYFGVLNKFIMGDTTQTGERAYPDAIYRLERGKFYDVNESLQLNFNITIDATPDDPSNPKRPPMILFGNDAQGSKIGKLINVYGDGNYFELKGVLVQAVQPYVDEPDYDNRGRWGIFLEGAFHRVVVDSCIFHGLEAAVFQPRNTDRCSWKFTNNIFYNGRANQAVGGGGFYSNTVKTAYNDTIIFRNNTFFNFDGNLFLSWEFVDYVEYTHNTMYNSTINGLWTPLSTNAKFNDNLYVDFQTVGETEWEYVNGHWDKGSPRHGHASILKLNICDPQILADHRMEESDRKIEVNNNAYWWNQDLKDYWENGTSQKDIDMGYSGEIHPVTWINAMTDSMFKSIAPYNYPHLVQENNIEADPGFDAQMVADVFEKELAFIKEYRKLGWTLLPDAPKDMLYCPDGKLFDLTWPLPWSLAYTNEDLLKHAEGGFPVGDLNWFPDKKAEWEDWVSSVEPQVNHTTPRNYELSQNYPNPFNPVTSISFTIPASGKTSLEVYNVLGQKVVTLVNNEKLSAGSYKYKFNAANLTSGIYFYKLQSKNYSQTKKMMLIK
jgi:hypothetical protein